MNFLFGIPYFKEKINPELYDKKKLIQNIEYNYKIEPFRNKWNLNENFHQSYFDENNSKFLTINYQELYPLYEEKVFDFFSQLKLKDNLKLRLKIVNYTCSQEEQSMEFHIHYPSFFYGIHYLQFDSEFHTPTIHQNSHEFSKYSDVFHNGVEKLFDETDIDNSWLYRSYRLATEEDDFLIVPSTIFHGVPKSYSNSSNNQKNKLRITIAMNIFIDN